MAPLQENRSDNLSCNPGGLTETGAVSNMYNTIIADHIDRDPFELYSSTRSIAIRQIVEATSKDNTLEVVDVGCGTGLFLRDLHMVLPKSSLTGLDASRRMLEIASARFRQIGFPIEWIDYDAHQLTQILPLHTYDLVAAHYVMAYLQPDDLLANISEILRPGGLVSIATCTNQSFARLQALCQNFLLKDLLRQLVSVPEDGSVILSMLERHGFEVMECQDKRTLLHFTSYEELYEFGTTSAWLTQQMLLFPPEAHKQFATENAALFPFEDTHECMVILARLPKEAN